LDRQNNYVERLRVNNNATKSFNNPTISLNDIIILRAQTKLFSNLYLAKFLDTSTT